MDATVRSFEAVEPAFVFTVLSAAAALAGLTVATGHPRCVDNPQLLGGWERTQATVFLCSEAIAKLGQSPEEVLKHELIHVIQERYPAALLPEPLLSILSRSFIPSEDALAIITGDDDSTNEFECRVLSKMLSNEVVAQWLHEVTIAQPSMPRPRPQGIAPALIRY